MKLSPTFTFITAIAVSLLALTNSTGAVEMKKAPIVPFPAGRAKPLREIFYRSNLSQPAKRQRRRLQRAPRQCNV